MIPYRTLGRTGERVSAIGLGGYHLGKPWVVPFRDQHGDIVQWYGTSTDIEDRKRAERRCGRPTASVEP